MRMPVARRTSMVAQAQNARPSSAVRLRRFPVAGSSAQTLAALLPVTERAGPFPVRGLRGPAWCRGQPAAAPGRRRAGGRRSGPGPAVPGAVRGSGRPSATCGAAGPCPGWFPPGRRGTARSPWSPPAGVVDGPLGQVEVEGPHRGQELAVADPLGINHRRGAGGGGDGLLLGPQALFPGVGDLGA